MGTESGHSGTTENSFSIGDGGDGYKYIYVNNSDAAQPGLRWNDDANQWEISDDGINWEKIKPVPAPIDAQYVVLAANGDLTNERVLEAAAGELALVDGGAGASVTLGLAPTGVAAGYYVSTDLTVDGYGRITDASDGYGGVYDGYGDVKYDVDYSPPPAPGGIIVSKLLPEGNYLLQAWAWIFSSGGEGDGIYIWLAKNGVQIDDTLDFCASYINYYWFRQIMVFSEYGEDVFSINAYQVGTGGTAYANNVSLAITRITPPGPPYAVGVFIDLPVPDTVYTVTDTMEISGTFYTPTRIDTLRVLYDGNWHFVDIVDDTWSISLFAILGSDTIEVEALYLDSRIETDSVNIVVQEIVGFPESLFNDYYGLYMDLNVPEDITYNTQPTGVDLDMELNNTTNWTLMGGGLQEKDTGSVHSGVRSLKLTNYDQQPYPSTGYTYQAMMIIGNNYIIDGYWRGDGVTGCPYYADGGIILGSTTYSDALAESATWRSWLIERTPVVTQLRLGCANITGVECSAYHDDISLRNLSINSVECKGNMGNLTQATAASMPWLSDDECVTSFNINGNPALWHGLTPSYQYDYLASDQAAASWTLHKTTGFSVGFNFGGLESSLIDGGILFSTCNSFIDANIGVSVAVYGDQLYVAVNNGADKTYDGYHGIILEDENVVVITMDETSLTVKLNSNELSIQAPLSVFSASDPTHTLRVGGRDLQGWIKDFLIFNGKITDGERDDLFDLLRSQLDFRNPLMFGDLFCWYKAQDIDALIVKAPAPNLLQGVDFNQTDAWLEGPCGAATGYGYLAINGYRSALTVYYVSCYQSYAYQDDIFIIGNKYQYSGGVASTTDDAAAVYIGSIKICDNDVGQYWRDYTLNAIADSTRFMLKADVNTYENVCFSAMYLTNLSRTRINNKGGSYDGYFYSDTPAEQPWFESDSIRFDSTDTLAASTDPADFTFLHDGYSTFVMKFKCNSITGDKYLFDTGNADGYDVGFQIIRNSADLNVVIKDGISVVGGVTAGTLVSGTTYVLVVRINETDTITYLNGATDTAAHIDTLSTDPPYQCIIGGTAGGGITDDFDLIDLIMYERPITDNELNLLLTNYFEI